MKTSIVNLRYRMKDVLKALDRKEKVEILYYGRPKGVILPVNSSKTSSVKQHPLFGMMKREKKSVKSIMDELRGERFGHAF